MIVTILVFILILSILVIVHEAGHFFVAKFFKIKVEEFGFGLPPRAFGIKYGETIYSINWLPIGGFVKLYGEDEAGSGSVSLKKQKQSTKDIDRAYFARPKWQKALVVSAGVIMNFLLAVTIISILFSVVGVAVPTEKVVVSALINGAPAQKAGLKVGDTIISANGEKVTSTMQVIALSRKLAGKEISFKVKTAKNVQENLAITPRKDYPKDQGPMGIAITQETAIKKYPVLEAPVVGLKEALKETYMIGSGLVLLVSQLVRGVVPSDVAGPVGIAQLTGKVVEIGPAAVLSFISLLSLNLAIMNILPIPALDGGRLFFILFEAFTGKKVNPNIETYAHTIGMAILLALIALITLHDILRILSGQSILPK